MARLGTKRMVRLKEERSRVCRDISLLKTGRYENETVEGWIANDDRALPISYTAFRVGKPDSVGGEIKDAVELLRLEKRLAEIDEERESW